MAKQAARKGRLTTEGYSNEDVTQIHGGEPEPINGSDAGVSIK